MGLTGTGSNFEESGPSNLTSTDWTKEDDKRIIVACLVQGVYQAKRTGLEGPALPWWESFHFQPVDLLKDGDDDNADDDTGLFGVVFKYKPKHETEYSPRYVIALRETILPNWKDIKHDIRIMKNTLHHSKNHDRCCEVIDALHKTGVAHPKIWLAGHSLGSSFATLVGRAMAKRGIFLTTFLFNPPFLSISIGRIKPEIFGVRTTRSMVKAGLAHLIKGKDRLEREEAQFVTLSEWVPNLFVNPGDPICSEYKNYFEQRNAMKKKGLGKIENVATQNSIRGLLKCAMGDECYEPIHHIPSARVITTNVGGTPTVAHDLDQRLKQWFKADFKEDHGLSQWWKEDLDLDYKVYKYAETSDLVNSE